MHSVIMTILMRSRPDEIKLLIIDPKQVEMMRYEELPHLLAPIINDYSHAKAALTKLLEEMANRYELFKQVGISSIDAYNRYARDNGIEPLPLIATIIDEYADLVDGIPAISDIVERLAAMSRAAGIHLIIATQRPTTKVVSGNIKNNIITKVALQMNAPVDSVTVLGHAGAEKLLGNGDMIVSCPKLSRYGELRLQGAFVSEEDTLRVVDFYKKRYQPSYHPAFANILDEGSGVSLFPGFSFTQSDEQYEQIKAFTLTQEYMSSNRIMREFKVGFSRSKEIILQLQDEGVLAQGPDSPQSNKGIKVIANGENI
jgi:S-DNA-T family DNA segregation ATPase FtsK/SpoIIIE